MPQKSIFARFHDRLAVQHRCAPPDALSHWTAVPSFFAERGDVYVCPECGQCLARAYREFNASAEQRGSVPLIATRQPLAFS